MQHFTSRSNLSFFCLLVIFVYPGNTHAQTTIDASSTVPLTITSQTMTVNNKENITVFDHNVVIKKGDLTITSDHVEIILKDDQSPSLPSSTLNSGSISQLHAWGNVKMDDGKRNSQAHEAIYNQEEDTVTLLGEPVLFEEGYKVTGTKMTFYIKDNKSIIENSKVLIHSQESNKKTGK